MNTNARTKYNYRNTKYEETVSGIVLYQTSFGGELWKPV